MTLDLPLEDEARPGDGPLQHLVHTVSVRRGTVTPHQDYALEDNPLFTVRNCLFSTLLAISCLGSMTLHLPLKDEARPGDKWHT